MGRQRGMGRMLAQVGQSGTVVLLVIVCLLSAWPAQPVRAGTQVVTSLADDGSSGTLRLQIANASAGDTITFQSGLTGTITLISGELVLDKNLTITGPGAASLSISGGDATRVLNVQGVTATISGVTITHGRAASGTTGGSGGTGGNGLSGGGISNVGALTLTNCTVSSNVAGNGGNGGSGGGAAVGGAMAGAFSMRRVVP